MASIRKRNGKWLADVRVKGNSKSKSFETRAEAQRWAQDYEHQLGKHPGLILSHTLREAMQRYAREVTPGKKGVRWELVRLEKLQRDPLVNIVLSDLKRDDIQAWIGRQTISAASINRELNLIGSVLREARVNWKWMITNPMEDVKRPKDPPPRDRLISEAEKSRILLALDYKEGHKATTARHQLAIAFLLALETAMRQGEIWGLMWENTHLGRNFISLPDTKNGTRRDVPLTARAVALLKKMEPQKSGKIFTSNQESAGSIFRSAVKLAGLKDLTFHDTRHTAITQLARKLDVLDLARMVGHRDIRSLQIYYNATAEDIASRLN